MVNGKTAKLLEQHSDPQAFADTLTGELLATAGAMNSETLYQVRLDRAAQRRADAFEQLRRSKGQSPTERRLARDELYAADEAYFAVVLNKAVQG